MNTKEEMDSLRQITLYDLVHIIRKPFEISSWVWGRGLWLYETS